MNKYIVVEEKVENYFNDIIFLGKILANIDNNFIFRLFILPSSRFLISGLISIGLLSERIKTQFYKNSLFDDLLLADFGTEFNIQHSNYKGSKSVKIKHCVIGCDRCENKNIFCLHSCHPPQHLHHSNHPQPLLVHHHRLWFYLKLVFPVYLIYLRSNQFSHYPYYFQLVD